MVSGSRKVDPDINRRLGSHSAARDLEEGLLERGIGDTPVPAAQRHVSGLVLIVHAPL